jgi:hypothetical protein
MKINSPFVIAGLRNEGIRLTMAFIVVNCLVNLSVVHWTCVGHAVVGWDTDLQAGRWRIRFPVGSLGFFVFEVIWFHTEAEEIDSDVAGIVCCCLARSPWRREPWMNNVIIFRSVNHLYAHVYITEGLWIDIFYMNKKGFDSFSEHVHCTCIKIATDDFKDTDTYIFSVF